MSWLWTHQRRSGVYATKQNLCKSCGREPMRTKTEVSPREVNAPTSWFDSQWEPNTSVHEEVRTVCELFRCYSADLVSVWGIAGLIWDLQGSHAEMADAGI